MTADDREQVIARLMSGKYSRPRLNMARWYLRAVAHVEDPTLLSFETMIKDSGWSEGTTGKRRSALSVAGFIERRDDGSHYFTEDWVSTLQTELEHKMEDEGRAKTLRERVLDLDPDQPLDTEAINIDWVTAILEHNPEYEFRSVFQPETPPELDFNKYSIQHIRVRPLTRAVITPYFIKQRFRCQTCGESVLLPTSIKGFPPRCRTKTCRGASMVFDSDTSLIKQAWAYQTKIGETIVPVISFEFPPPGDSGAHVLLQASRREYSLLVLSYYDVPHPSPTIHWSSTHRIFDIIKAVDRIAQDQINKTIVGLEYYKMALVLSRMSSMTREFHNISAYGDRGTGKTSTFKVYGFTLTHPNMVSVVPRKSLSIPGIRGSTQEVTIRGQSYKIPTTGLFEQHLVCMDEVPLQGQFLETLKHFLSEQSSQRALAGDMGEQTKKATVVVTSNPSTASPRSSMPTQMDIWNKKGLSSNVMEARDKLLDKGLDWVTGSDLTVMDRFAYNLRFKGMPAPKDQIEAIVEGDDRIADSRLKLKLYTPDLEDYLLASSHVRVVFDHDLKDWLDEMRKIYRVPRSVETTLPGCDHLHEDTRFLQYWGGTAKLLARIDRRTKVNDLDKQLTEELFQRMIHKRTLNELSIGGTLITDEGWS